MDKCNALLSWYSGGKTLVGFQTPIPYASVAESVDAPDLKSVGHYARGSSSLPTRTK